MPFTFAQKVLFKHCDPAGIAFYPRLCEMINDATGALFDAVLDWPFETLHPEHAVPTAALNIQFRTPCRMGDQLTLQLTVRKLGRTSLTLKTEALAGDELRFEAVSTLVCLGPGGRPTPWPDAVRSRVARMMEATA